MLFDSIPFLLSIFESSLIGFAIVIENGPSSIPDFILIEFSIENSILSLHHFEHGLVQVFENGQFFKFFLL